MPEEDYNEKPVLCELECFHYGMFGGVGCCDPDDWGSLNIPIEPGQKCLYPDKKHQGVCLGTFSVLGLCSALEGTVVSGGEHDNTKLVQILTK